MAIGGIHRHSWTAGEKVLEPIIGLMPIIPQLHGRPTLVPNLLILILEQAAVPFILTVRIMHHLKNVEVLNTNVVT